jgi:hypothetical protein
MLYISYIINNKREVNGMRLTKNDMARVIIQALHNKKELPKETNCNVVRMAKRYNKEDLLFHYNKAVEVLNNEIKKRG